MEYSTGILYCDSIEYFSKLKYEKNNYNPMFKLISFDTYTLNENLSICTLKRIN